MAQEEQKLQGVTVRLLSGKKVPIAITPGQTVEQLKRLVQEKEGFPPDQQRLIHEGKQLEDRRTCSDYNIPCLFGPSDNIHLLLRLCSCCNWTPIGNQWAPIGNQSWFFFQFYALTQYNTKTTHAIQHNNIT